MEARGGQSASPSADDAGLRACSAWRAIAAAPGDDAAASLVADAIASAACDRHRVAVLLVETGAGKGAAEAPADPDPLIDRLRPSLRDGGPIALADDRCLVVLRNLADSAQVFAHTRTIFEAAAAARVPAARPDAYRVRIGIGLFPEDGDTYEELIERASQALDDLRRVGKTGAGLCLRRRATPRPARGLRDCARPPRDSAGAPDLPVGHHARAPELPAQ